MRKKVLCSTLALSLILSFNVKVFGAPSLDEQLNASNSKYSNSQSSLKEAQSKAKDLQSQIENLDTQIQQTMTEISDTENKIKEKETNIKEAESTIARAEENIKIERDRYNKSMRSMYMSGSTAYVNVLLDSNGINDFISKVEIVNKVAEYNDNVISNLTQRQQSITKKKTALEGEKQTLVALENNQKSKLDEVNKQKIAEQPLVDQAKAALNNAIALNSAAQSEVDSINSKVKAAKDAEAAEAAATAANTTNVTVNRGGNYNFSSDAVVTYAASFQGVPYVWGGTSPSGFDCSGFVQYVYAHFGVSLPRTSEEQFGAGTSVSESNLQPGDLVFFHNSGSGPGHVGMYIGNGLMIHAPHTGDVVKIMPLSYENGFCGAKRFK